ncbi:MAG TPA: helix-turn-helix domain-containing protein, partial [Candidatus Limnocylindrales bacterium]|nr:helix-turn-helix domain-containing protein [Candidatus Limnocylindrales bacterium]
MSEPGQKLGEVLRSTREAKAVDVARVERDTKIRARYVEALERGEYRDLPGAVYTKGFLRNYGLYLGLDPEYLIDLYRLETSGGRGERPSVPTPPRPIGRRRRGIVVERNVVVAAILTIVVVGLVAYLGIEFMTFARTPDLRITDPEGNVRSWSETSYTLRGVTARNARVDVSGLRENPSVTAGPDGSFEVEVGLVPGSNVIAVTAWDPEVSRESETVTRTITVVGPEPSGAPLAQITLDSPAEGATSDGNVAFAGSTSPGATLTLTPTLAAPVTATFTVVDAATGQPIPGARIEVVGSEIRAYSGADGRYTLVRVPEGTHAVTVTFLGYATETVGGIRVVAGRVVQQDVALTPAVLDLDRITV